MSPWGRPRALGSLPAIPAIGAQLALVNAHRLNHVVQPVVAQGGEVQLFADVYQHGAVLAALRVGVPRQVGGLFGALHFLDDPPGDQVHYRGGTGEVQVFTAEQDLMINSFSSATSITRFSEKGNVNRSVRFPFSSSPI